MKAKNAFRNTIIVVVPLIIGIVIGVWQIKPPFVDTNSVSYQRMMNNIERFTHEPHVSGSKEIEIVCAEIVAEIEGMGLTPIIQEVEYTRDEVIAARVRLGGNPNALPGRFHLLPDTLTLRNIFVKLEAPDSDNGILFATHYDSFQNNTDGSYNSAYNTYGAADAMLPVCALLEALRSQADNNALTNDVYFLFTDGEEYASIGALAFLEANPELRDKIDMFVNIDAQGNSGGLLVYETSPKSYGMLDIYRKTVTRPIGFSVAAAIYSAMGTYTDFTFFSEYGYRGINLAIVEGYENYHQPSDNYENLDTSTAGHFLSTTLSLAEHAAKNSLDSLDGQSTETVFFPFLPGNMVLISHTLAYILCALACTLVVAYLIYESKNKRLKASFSTIHMLLLTALSVVSAIYFHAGSYLFWIPLFAMTVTAFLKKWTVAYHVAQMLSRTITLMLFVPLIFLVLAVASLLTASLPISAIQAQIIIIAFAFLLYLFFCLMGLRRKAQT